MSRKPRLYRTAAAFSLGKLSLLMLAMGGMTASSAVLAAEVKAKNVIIMINDGAGWGTWMQQPTGSMAAVKVRRMPRFRQNMP